MAGKGNFMFTFEIIEPKNEKEGEKLLNLILNKLRPSEKKTTIFYNYTSLAFMIAENKQKRLLGGACLFKKNLPNIQADIRTLIESPSHSAQPLWECSDIYIEKIIDTTSQSTPKNEGFSSLFYEKLYDKLVEFGRQKEINFLVMKLSREAYFSSKQVGMWPYVIELKPKNSYDGLFHGVLPLTGKQYESYKNERLTLKENYRHLV